MQFPNIIKCDFMLLFSAVFLLGVVACLAPTTMDLSLSTGGGEAANTIYRQKGRITGQITIAVLRNNGNAYAQTVKRLREWQRRLAKIADLKVEIESQKLHAITTSAPLLVISSYPAGFESETSRGAKSRFSVPK